MPSLTDKQRQEAEHKVYFPIVTEKARLKRKLCMGMMDSLDAKYPKIFSYLDSIQPYNSGYEWMANFSKFANERHTRLSRQKRAEQKYLVFEHKGERHNLWATAEVGSVGILIGSKKIHPNQRLSHDSEHIKADPEVKITKKKSITFVFTGTQIDAIGLCHTVVIEGKSIISKFLSLS